MYYRKQEDNIRNKKRCYNRSKADIYFRFGHGAYYDSEKKRYIRYWNSPGQLRFWRRHMGKKIRHAKPDDLNITKSCYYKRYSGYILWMLW